MNWLHSLAWFFGGAFLLNAMPHIVAGAMGRPFQSPPTRAKCCISA